MPEKQNSNKFISFILNNAVAVGAVVIILFLFIPVGKTVIDIAMVMNLAIAFLLLLRVVSVKRAADFTSFPQLVLFVTLFGLAINVSSTRNILAHPVKDANNMPGQSEMVQTFASIVAQNNVLIGFIIFVILIVVQVLVVTKGADRVAEVTARFTLDAMNTKKFSLQNKLNSGSLTQEEYDLADAQLDAQIDFYSAMDGSSKFVSGNVKAGIFITVVNLIGGIITGYMGGGGNDILAAYAKLTIGDGLMSQLPAIMLSFSTGLLITASNNGIDFTEKLKGQFSSDSVAYTIVGATLCVLGVAFHNSASFVLILIGILFVFVGNRISKVNKKRQDEAEVRAADAKNKAAQGPASPEEISPIAKLDELSLEVGYALIPLVDKEKGAELLARVKRIRHESALDLGLVIPPIHIMDQMELAPEEYSFKIRGIEVGKGRLKMGHYMCLNTGNVMPGKELVGEVTRDPAFGMEAIWLPETKRAEAEKAGYAVIDAPTTIATHLTELIRRNASIILNRQTVSAIIDEVKKTNNVVVDEVINTEKFTYGEIEAVLRNLLDEQVSIRNMVEILETLGDYGRLTHDPWVLTEKVRESLGAQICQQYADEDKVLHVLNLSQTFAEKIVNNISQVPGGEPILALDPVDGRNFITAMSNAVAAVRERNLLPIVLCPAQIRRVVKSSTSREMPGIIVISVNEVMNAGANIKIESLGEING